MPSKIIPLNLSILIFGLTFFFSSVTLADKYTTQPLKEIAYFPSYSFSASVISHTQSQISSEISAKLLNITVRPGQAVRQNSLLAEMDCRDTQDRLKLIQHRHTETKASLKLAQLQLERFKNLKERQYTATSQIDESLAQVQRLEASIAGLITEEEMAQRSVQHCRILAPFDGTVSEIVTGAGAWVNTGEAVLTLIRQNDAEIEVSFPPKLAAQLEDKKAVWQTMGQSPTELKFLRKSAILDNQKRMVSAWYQAPKSETIGNLGTLILTDNRLYLPADLLVQRQRQLGVFSVENAKVVFNVIPEAQVGRPFAVPTNWTAEKRLVTTGQQSLPLGE